MLPAVESGLFALPVLAQFGQCAPGEALVLLGLCRLPGAISRNFCLVLGVDRNSLFGDGLSVFLLLFFQLLRGFLLCGDVELQLVALFKLLAPDAKAFAQLRALRVGGTKFVDLAALVLNPLQLLLSLFGDLGCKAMSGIVLLVVFYLPCFALDMQRLQFAIALPAGGIGLFPNQVQWFQRFCRFVGGQTL